MFQTKLKSAFEKVRQDKKVLEKNLSEVELETKFLQEDNQNLESKLSSRATEVEKLEEDLKAEKEGWGKRFSVVNCARVIGFK